MSYEDVPPLGAENRFVRLLGLWLLTGLALVAGGWVVGVLGFFLPAGGWSVLGLPLLWRWLMRKGLRWAVGDDAAQPQPGLYWGFALSQVVALLGLLLWLMLSEPTDNTPWFD